MTSYAQLLPVRLYVGQDGIRRLHGVFLDIEYAAGHLFTVLCQQANQIGRSGNSGHRIDIGIKTQRQGENRVDGSLLFHVLGGGGSDGEVRDGHASHGTGDGRQ